MNKDVRGLMKVLRHYRNPDIRWKAAFALVSIGDSRVVESLIEGLHDEDPDTRLLAAYALGEIGDARAAKPLIEVFCQDEATGVIQNVRLALQKIFWLPEGGVEKACYFIAIQQWDKLPELGKPAVLPLIQALKDRDYDTIKRAAEALGEIGDRRAVAPLNEALARLSAELGMMDRVPLRIRMSWEKDTMKGSKARRAIEEALDKIGKKD